MVDSSSPMTTPRTTTYATNRSHSPRRVPSCTVCSTPPVPVAPPLASATPLAQHLGDDFHMRAEIARAISFANDIKRTRTLLKSSLANIKDGIEAWANESAAGLVTSEVLQASFHTLYGTDGDHEHADEDAEGIDSLFEEMGATIFARRPDVLVLDSPQTWAGAPPPLSLTRTPAPSPRLERSPSLPMPSLAGTVASPGGPAGRADRSCVLSAGTVASPASPGVHRMTAWVSPHPTPPVNGAPASARQNMKSLGASACGWHGRAWEAPKGQEALRFRQGLVEKMRPMLATMTSWDYDATGEMSLPQFFNLINIFGIDVPRLEVTRLYESFDMARPVRSFRLSSYRRWAAMLVNDQCVRSSRGRTGWQRLDRLSCIRRDDHGEDTAAAQGVAAVAALQARQRWDEGRPCASCAARPQR